MAGRPARLPRSAIPRSAGHVRDVAARSRVAVHIERIGDDPAVLAAHFRKTEERRRQFSFGVDRGAGGRFPEGLEGGWAQIGSRCQAVLDLRAAK
jgi:hypothetical protein